MARAPVRLRRTERRRRQPARNARAKIREMVRRIVERFHPDKIILFGSYARGTAGPDSDADLLVVMPVSRSKRQQAVEIDVALAGIGLPKDVIVVTPQEFARYRNVVGTIIYPAVREGVLVYDRPARIDSLNAPVD